MLCQHVSPRTIHFRVLDKSPVSSPGRGPPSCKRRTDAEAEVPILCPPDVKSLLIGKDPDTGKDWGQEGKRAVGWDGWMASRTQWTRVWAGSGRWWRIGKPGVLQSMGSQRVRHDLATEWQCNPHHPWGLWATPKSTSNVPLAAFHTHQAHLQPSFSFHFMAPIITENYIQ